MKHTYSIKLYTMLLVIFTMTCFDTFLKNAESCEDYWTAAYKCMQGCGCAEGPTQDYDDRPVRDYAAEAREEAERVERNAQYTASYTQATDAWNRKDWREALKLYQQAQQLRGGPKGALAIKRCKAYIAWDEARTSKEFRHAIAMNREGFTPENLEYIKTIEAKEKEERERPAREAKERKIAEKNAKAYDAWDKAKTSDELRRAIAMQPSAFTEEHRNWVKTTENLEKTTKESEEKRKEQDRADLIAAKKMTAHISDFAAQLDLGDPKAGKQVVKNSDVGINDGLGGHRSDTTILEFGDPNAPEAKSMQARQGFDDNGRLIGTEAVTVPVVPEGVEIDARIFKAEGELTNLETEKSTMEAEITKLTQERNATQDSKKMQELTAVIDQKTAVKEQKNVEIVQKKEENKKLHRTIGAEIATKKGSSK